MAPYDPIDVEWAVAQAIEDETEMDVGATMVPADLEDRLPYVLVRSVGGSVADRVIDQARLAVDVWAESPAEAVRAANAAFGAAMRLGDYYDTFRGDTVVFARPYPIRDEDHPTLSHVRALVGVTTITER